MIEAIKNLGLLIHLNQQLGKKGKEKIKNAQKFSKIVETSPSLVAQLLTEPVGHHFNNVKVFVISDKNDGIYEDQYDAENYWK